MGREAHVGRVRRCSGSLESSDGTWDGAGGSCVTSTRDREQKNRSEKPLAKLRILQVHSPM